jgi:hypothetical protein
VKSDVSHIYRRNRAGNKREKVREKNEREGEREREKNERKRRRERERAIIIKKKINKKKIKKNSGVARNFLYQKCFGPKKGRGVPSHTGGKLHPPFPP